MNVWGNLKMGRCVKNWVAVGKKALHKWEPFVSLFKNMHIYCFTNSLPQKWHCVKVDASSTSFPPTHQKCDCMWALCCCNVCVCRVGLGGRGLAVCAANRVWSWCSRLCSQRRSDTGCFFSSLTVKALTSGNLIKTPPLSSGASSWSSFTQSHVFHPKSMRPHYFPHRQFTWKHLRMSGKQS